MSVEAGAERKKVKRLMETLSIRSYSTLSQPTMARGVSLRATVEARC